MIKTRILTAVFLMATVLSVTAADNDKWTHIFHGADKMSSLKNNDITRIIHNNPDNGEASVTFCGNDSDLSFPINEIDSCVIGTGLPTVRITLTDYPGQYDLIDKETYLNATVSLDGNGEYDNLTGLPATIKGRGNSTWLNPKKPYRIKFDKKQSLLGMMSAKNYVLLANYIDETHLHNSVALLAAEMLEMPYTNSFHPVRVFLNGDYKGLYLLTEKVGIKAESVDIDELTGVLFELDSNYDEEFRFKSGCFQLPVMIKDPDLHEISADTGLTEDEMLELWRNDFNTMEKAVANGENIWYYIDIESAVNYLIVYNFTGCTEVDWPKSVYLHKASPGDKYHFGPVWDFDFAYTYNNGSGTRPYDYVLLDMWDPLIGSRFFREICQDATFKQLYAERWEAFRRDIYPSLVEFISEESKRVRYAAMEDGSRWPDDDSRKSSFNYDENISILLQWLDNRMTFISSDPNFGLYR